MFTAALSPEEDATLRRLVFFEDSGLSLAAPLQLLRTELRARDRRRDVRPPEVSVVQVPDYAY